MKIKSGFSLMAMLGAFLFFGTAAFAQSQSQTNVETRPVLSKTTKGFTASAALVNDPDWEQKWADSYSTTPVFIPARELNPDQPATLLIYFSDPLEKNGEIHVSCDVEIRDAGREVVGRLSREHCLTRMSTTESGDVFLFPVMELTHLHINNAGLLTVEIGVTDENREHRIPLSLTIYAVRQ